MNIKTAMRKVYGLKPEVVAKLLAKYEFGGTNLLKEIETVLLLECGEEPTPREWLDAPSLEWQFCKSCLFYDAVPIGSVNTCKCGGRLV